MPRTTRRSLIKQDDESHQSPPTSTRKVVRNSSDLDDDDLEDEVIIAPRRIPRSKIAVVVPPRNTSKARSTASASDASAFSTDMKERDTPDTSATGTPFAVDKNSGRKTAAANLNKVNKRLSATRAKQSIATEQTTADEELAMMLQEEAYADDVDDEDVSDFAAPEESEAEDFDPDESEEDFVPLKKRKATKQKENPRKRPKIDITATTISLFNKRPEGTKEGSPAGSSDLSSIGEMSEGELEQQITQSAKYAKHKQVPWKPKPRGMARDEWERRKLEIAHPMVKTLWDDLEREVDIFKPEPGPQPVYINRQLKPFQLQGVAWMRLMETEGRWKGGLLGDEMGMGKTIQAVSLIMSDYPAGKPSLVVVPPVALMQWSAEITSYTNGKLKVLVYHNADSKIKNMKVAELNKYDVIMVSYSSLESMHRKEVEGWKRDDGLVKENSKIHSIQFHRLILDEAHSIKTRTTKVARSCFALKADYKWCLSGTPVQNRIGEFFSLLRFLEVHPFCNYLCKKCDCSSLHWATDETRSCASCGHRGFDHVSLFNQELLNPMTDGDASQRKEAMRKLRLLTDRIMLRRLKRDHTASMELPPKQVVIHNEFFGKQERDFSKSIMSNTAREFDTYVARGVMLNNYANIFGLIMQMRQVANHPDLILRKNAEGGANTLVCCICDETAEEPIRSFCRHEFCRQCVKDYVRGFDKTGSPDCPRCHIALKIDFDQPDIEQDEETVKKSSIVNRIKMENWHSSTKIEMLIYDLYKLRSPKQTVKSIIFSQFTSMLQLVDWRLHRAGFNTVMLDGSMSPQQRQKSIDHFMTTVDCEIFLVSLKAGGVALNLTEASHVFIIDPWWNPAAEWQSADRVHRIGQRRPCVITRLVIEDSVESRMVMLQEKKANLINSTVNRDDVALDKLSPEDMQFLFRGS